MLALYVQLQTQIPALIDRNTPMTLALSNMSEPNMGKVTAYTRPRAASDQGKLAETCGSSPRRNSTRRLAN